MRSLFVEKLLVAPLEPNGVVPELRYDEQRCMSVLPDGRPLIETGLDGRTDTLTEVRAEQDDYDRPEEGDRLLVLETTTKVKREGDDIAALLLATETRQAPENDDFARGELSCATETAIGGEADDFARAEYAHGDQDRPSRSTPWLAPGGAWADTKTSVGGENDDFAPETDALEGPPVQTASLSAY
jgi:hypothetical protein